MISGDRQASIGERGPFATLQGEFAQHLTRASEAIEGGDLTSLNELALIFAPTGEWDDAGGSVTTGNDIYQRIRQCRAA